MNYDQVLVADTKLSIYRFLHYLQEKMKEKMKYRLQNDKRPCKELPAFKEQMMDYRTGIQPILCSLLLLSFDDHDLPSVIVATLCAHSVRSP